MGTHTDSIAVDRPLSTVYNQWTQFESFPHFMEGVESVQQLDDRNLHWKVAIGGVAREFDATIEEQVPDSKIAWRAVDGPYQAGEVSFQELGPATTQVSLRMDFEPSGFAENVGEAMGLVSRRISGDLERFKSYVEQEGGQAPGWRGEI